MRIEMLKKRGKSAETRLKRYLDRMTRKSSRKGEKR